MSPKDSPHSPSAMANQQYCLKWNNHQSNLLRAFDRLLQSESFTDVTLACEGKSLRAHKVVLSACSSYFEQLFEEHPDKSPIIILKDMKFTHVSQLVNFMYRGEINITQDMLSGLLKTAETLKVKGLAEVSGDQPAQVANPMPPILRLAASSHGPRFVTQEMLQHSRQASLPQMVPPNSSPLTTALNAPMVAPPTLAPLAALLNPERTSANQIIDFRSRESHDLTRVNYRETTLIANPLVRRKGRKSHVKSHMSHTHTTIRHVPGVTSLKWSTCPHVSGETGPRAVRVHT